MASYKTGDDTEQTYPGEEKQQRCSEDSDVNGKLTFMSYEVNPVNNFDSFIQLTAVPKIDLNYTDVRCFKDRLIDMCI